MNLCKCGCGEKVQQNYKHGHGRKGKHNSIEHNLAIKKSNTGRIINDETRKRMSECQKGRKHSKETRKKMSEIAKEKGFGKWMTGKKIPFDVIEKKRLKMIGHITTEEARRKISQANSGEKNGMYGKRYSIEEKLIISNMMQEIWKNPLVKEKSKISRSTPEFKKYLRENALRIAEKIKKKGYHNTKPELKMMELLKNLNIKFIHPFPVWNIEHCYSADFFIPESNTIIEVDGIYWHNLENVKTKDRIREEEMKEAGYNVLRFWENELNEENLLKAGL